jgi:WD40 repeat protein
MHEITPCSTGHKAMPLLNTEHYPDELWLFVSSRLKLAKDLMALRATNRHLYDICLDTPQWEVLLEQYFPHSFAKAGPSADYPNVYRQGALQWGAFKNMSSPDASFRGGGYKQFCIHQNRLFSKWGSNLHISDLKTRQIIGSFEINAAVLTNFQVQGDFLCAAGGKKAEVWRVSSGLCVHEWNTDMDVEFFQVQGNLLCIGSKEGQVKIWNTCTGEQVLNLATKASIRNLQLWGDLLFFEGSSWEDIYAPIFFLRMLNIHESHVVNTFKAPPENRLITGMHFFQVEGDLLVVVAPAYARIGVWEISTRRFLRTIEYQGPLDNTNHFVQGNFFLAVGSYETKIWDIRSGELLHHFKTVTSTLPRSYVCEDFLIVFNENHNLMKESIDVEVWHIPTGKRVNIFSCQETAFLGPYSQKDGDFLCAESSRGIVAWDLLPHPSVYERGLLESNSKILQQMAQNLDEWPALIEKLDLRIRWHLTGTDAPCLEKVQTKVCLELLLHAVYDQDEGRTAVLLFQLESFGIHTLDELLEEHVNRKEKIQMVQAHLAGLY